MRLITFHHLPAVFFIGAMMSCGHGTSSLGGTDANLNDVPGHAGASGSSGTAGSGGGTGANDGGGNAGAGSGTGGATSGGTGGATSGGTGGATSGGTGGATSGGTGGAAGGGDGGATSGGSGGAAGAGDGTGGATGGSAGNSGSAGSGNSGGTGSSDADGATPTCMGTVIFADANLERAAQQALGVTGPISVDAAKSVTSLLVRFTVAEPLISLRGIECFTGLIAFNADGPDIPSLGSLDLSPLAAITGLSLIDIHFNTSQPRDNGPRTVFLDFSPLANHPGLKGLRFDINAVKDITPWSTLRLQTLQLWSEPLTDLSPLRQVTTLTRVLVRGKGITDIAPLAAAMVATPSSMITDTSVEDVSSLAALTSVQTFSLARNRIRDISPLLSWPVLRTLDVTGNPLDCATQMANIKALQARGVTVTHDCP
jgi:hypothetical protein